MWNPDIQYFMERWNEIWEEEKKEEFVKNQIKTLLGSQEFVMFFKKDKMIYGAEEEGRLIFAKIKIPDEDSKGSWGKDANFMGVNLTKGLKGDKVHNIFSKKDIKNIEVIDKDEAEKLLISQAKGKVKDAEVEDADEPGTIQLKDKKEWMSGNDLVQRAENNPVPPIQSIHTKVLLQLLRIVQQMKRHDSWNEPAQDLESRRVNPLLVTRDGYILSHPLHEKGYSEEEIRAELATREHVPNKEEAKKIRQQQAWDQRNR